MVRRKCIIRRLQMPKFKELRFRITGKVNGAEMTPTTIPMASLADYLKDLAAIFGSRDAVHLMKVDDGSAAPVVLVDVREEPRILYRAHQAQLGQGPRDANLAYRRLNNRLRFHQGSAAIEDVEHRTNVLEFPGVKVGTATPYGPISERGSVTGKIMRVGGL